MADSNFYRAFEDRYRGSRELIKSRLAVYLPFILPLKQFHGACQGIDLGCGRGEWLELMHENGLDVQGIDSDLGMLEAARERGLNAIHGDAIQFLQSLASESQVLVSGFHIAEHLPFELLQTLIRESLRVLKSGGLLILETPNPENIRVATNNFYLDPTHTRPVPLLLLSFLTEYYGFSRNKVLRLQESSSLVGSDGFRLIDVFTGVSPDYAVVAQKNAPVEQASKFDSAFGREYGLTLEALSARYEEKVFERISDIEARAQHAAARAQQAETRAQQAETKAQHAEDKAQHAVDKAQHAIDKAQHAIDKAQHAEDKAQHAIDKAQHAEAALIAIHLSTSWRITSPLRFISRTVKNIFLLPKAAKPKIKLLLAHSKLYINRRPRLRRVVLAVLTPFPVLQKRLKQAANVAPHAISKQPRVPDELADLSPEARRVYSELKSAIEQRRKGSVDAHRH